MLYLLYPKSAIFLLIGVVHPLILRACAAADDTGRCVERGGSEHSKDTKIGHIRHDELRVPWDEIWTCEPNKGAICVIHTPSDGLVAMGLRENWDAPYRPARGTLGSVSLALQLSV